MSLWLGRRPETRGRSEGLASFWEHQMRKEGKFTCGMVRERFPKSARMLCFLAEGSSSTSHTSSGFSV